MTIFSKYGLTFGRNIHVYIEKDGIRYGWDRFTAVSHAFDCKATAENASKSDEKFKAVMRILQRILLIDRVSTIFLILTFVAQAVNASAFILFAIACTFKIVFYFCAKIEIFYQPDSYGIQYVKKYHMLISSLRRNKQILLVRTNESVDRGWLANVMEKDPIVAIKRETPFFLRSNSPCFTLRLKAFKLFILPDKIMIWRKKSLQAISTFSIRVTAKEIVRSEKRNAPPDAQIVESTQISPKLKADPDRSLKKDTELFYRYGELTFSSPEGLHLTLLCSNWDAVQEFMECYHSLRDEAALSNGIV